MTDVELVERAAEAEARGGRVTWTVDPHCRDHGCLLCRGAALWQTLNGLRGLRLVSPTTGQRQGGERE